MMREFKMIKRLIFIFIIALFSPQFHAYAKDAPLALDSRIKTYVYSENEIFKVVVHYGYQVSIEFADGEEIQTISTGNNYAWQITPVGRRLFIKPLEENILTNMTIISNQRVYHIEVQSKGRSDSVDEELVYVVRFFYPSQDFESIIPDIMANNVDPIPTVKPFNFNYTLSGAKNIAPVKVFDDGTNTFFKFPDKVAMPKFEIEHSSGTQTLVPRQKGIYVVVNVVSNQIKLSLGKDVTYVHNENFKN
jgi:type IV secretion system protein VirB9